MVGHKICFYGEMWLIIPKLSLLPLLIWSTEGGIDILGIVSLVSGLQFRVFGEGGYISRIHDTRGYQKVLSLRHFPHSDSTMLHT